MAASSRQISFGDRTPQEGVDFEVIKAHWLEAEKLGYDSIWHVDHLFTIAFPHGYPQPDCWTTMSALAACTTKIRFGAMVLCNLFRQPSLLANMAATLDRISNGRLEFAIGAGWNEAEIVGYGYDFPKLPERMAMLDEALDIIKLIWQEEKASYQGKYYHIKDLMDCPRPMQQPHPPIWIGGVGEKLLLRIAAKHADVWNAPHLSPEQCARKIEVLNRHCREIGRNPDEISHSWNGWVYIDEDEERLQKRLAARAASENTTVAEMIDGEIAGTPEQCVERIKEYIDVGITQFACLFGKVSDLRGTQLFAKTVMPAFA